MSYAALLNRKLSYKKVSAALSIQEEDFIRSADIRLLYFKRSF